MTEEERREKISDRIRMHTSVSSHDNVPLVIDQLSDKNLKVAVYAYVAAPASDQVSSFELQTDMIMKQMERHPNWTLVDIYKDEGYSSNRKELTRMIEDCKAGKINLVLTRAISRLARNTDELLQIMKMLKNLDPPVGILFENENLYTLDSDSQHILELYSVIAEEERRMKARHYGERMFSGRWSGTSIPPEVRSLLGYKVTEKKGDDSK